jgi:hypothetical protein
MNYDMLFAKDLTWSQNCTALIVVAAKTGYSFAWHWKSRSWLGIDTKCDKVKLFNGIPNPHFLLTGYPTAMWLDHKTVQLLLLLQQKQVIPLPVITN